MNVSDVNFFRITGMVAVIVEDMGQPGIVGADMNREEIHIRINEMFLLFPAFPHQASQIDGRRPRTALEDAGSARGCSGSPANL
jgi:hypothetical protein